MRLIYRLTFAFLLAAAACSPPTAPPSRAQSPAAPEPAAESAPAAGDSVKPPPVAVLRLVYDVGEAQASEGDRAARMATALNVVRQRLGSLRDASLLSKNGKLVIEVPASEVESPAALMQLVERRTAFGMHVVEATAPYSKALFNHVTGDAGASAAAVDERVDLWRADGESAPRLDYYLGSPDLTSLKRYVAGYAAAHAPPAGLMFGFARDRSDEGGYRTYLLRSRPALDRTALARASVVWNPTTNQPEVLIDFSTAGAAAFAQVTRDHVGDRIAIVVDDEVVSAPVVQGAVTGGQTVITTGGAHPQEARAEVEDLVGLLRGAFEPWGPFTLLSQSTSLRPASSPSTLDSGH